MSPLSNGASSASEGSHISTNLTGLHNRRYLKAEFPPRREASAYTLLLLDLDGFKGVNDLHGHDVGDAVLRTIAGRIVQCVPGGGEVVRLGDDEFAICLGGSCDEATGSKLADQIIAEAGLPITAGEAVVRVGVSVGLTSGGSGNWNLSDALRRADIAMYEAKRARSYSRSRWSRIAMPRAN